MTKIKSGGIIDAIELLKSKGNLNPCVNDFLELNERINNYEQYVSKKRTHWT